MLQVARACNCARAAHTEQSTNKPGDTHLPRLTNNDYLDQRHRLVIAWEFRSQLIAELEPYEQRALHDFFAMSREMYDDDAIIYRGEMKKLKPNLPHMAGRAYARFEQIVSEDRERHTVAREAVTTIPMRGAARPKKHVRVAALARPEVDVKGLARMIVKLAIEDQKNGGELLKQKSLRRHSDV